MSHPEPGFDTDGVLLHIWLGGIFLSPTRSPIPFLSQGQPRPTPYVFFVAPYVNPARDMSHSHCPLILNRGAGKNSQSLTDELHTGPGICQQSVDLFRSIANGTQTPAC